MQSIYRIPNATTESNDLLIVCCFYFFSLGFKGEGQGNGILLTTPLFSLTPSHFPTRLSTPSLIGDNLHDSSKTRNNNATSRIRNWNGRYTSASQVPNTHVANSLGTSVLRPKYHKIIKYNVCCSHASQYLLIFFCSVFSDKAQTSRTDAAKAEAVRRQSK